MKPVLDIAPRMRDRFLDGFAAMDTLDGHELRILHTGAWLSPGTFV